MLTRAGGPGFVCHLRRHHEHVAFKDSKEDPHMELQVPEHLKPWLNVVL